MKELYNNNDSKKEKDPVENQGQEEEGMQDWRNVYKKFFVDLHVYVYLYTQFQKVPGHYRTVPWESVFGPNFYVYVFKLHEMSLHFTLFTN